MRSQAYRECEKGNETWTGKQGRARSAIRPYKGLVYIGIKHQHLFPYLCKRTCVCYGDHDKAIGLGCSTFYAELRILVRRFREHLRCMVSHLL